MIVLGIHSVSHDPSAALLIDGEVVAAADEERFTRVKHGLGSVPTQAIEFCLEKAGLKPEEVQVVAYPWSREVIRRRRWRYLLHTLKRRPRKALSFFLRPYRRQEMREKLLGRTLESVGIDRSKVEIDYIDHHLAHAASAYHFSGFDHAAIVTLDGTGELQTTVFAEGRGQGIEILDEILKPDSLGFFYTAMTEYLGWEGNDGEYKLMGMAPYGDPSRVQLDDFLSVENGAFRLNQDYVHCSSSDAYRRGEVYSRRLVERLGPPREDEGVSEPYTHIAAATQQLFERTALALVEAKLGAVLERSGGRLCLAGGCALNVALNRRLLELPMVRELYVQPNAGDGGTSLGAAAVAAQRRGDHIQPMTHCRLGPAYTTEQCRKTLERFRISYEEPDDIIATCADLLAAGHPVAWFHGPMEWGPRALGNRSVLGHPGVKGQTNDINLRVKFRESWRPFCPSVLAEYGPQIFDSEHDSPFMTICFGVKEAWRERIPEVVHVDGSARPQYVTRERNPRFRSLIEAFHARTGIPCVINTSLNRRGEPIVCTPEDAVRMFFGCGVEFLVLEDLLVRKRN